MKDIILNSSCATSAPTRRKVAKSDLAITVGSGSLEVFATPMVIAMIEKAANEMLAQYLDDGEASVGTYICIEHTSATPLDMEVSARAKITAVNGREITFDVEASDEKGQIAHGTHKRFVINSEKFMAKATAKLA